MEPELELDSNIEKDPPQPSHDYIRIILFVTPLLLGMVALLVFLFLSLNTAPQSDTDTDTDINDESVADEVVADTAFVLETFFPETDWIDIKDHPDNEHELLIRDSFGITTVKAEQGLQLHHELSAVAPGISIGDFAQVGQLIIFASGDGVGVYDIVSKTVELYTTKDGLASSANIRLHPDPYDTDIVWVGTFRGLSKFSLRDRTFKSYAAEIGIGGTQWQPRVFYIDEETVWVIVGSNAYSTGGVARLTKATDEWTAWSTETFIVNENPNNWIDPLHLHEGSKDWIVIEEDNVEYLFDRSTQQWDAMRIQQQADPVRNGLALIDNWLYYKESDRLGAYNLVTGAEVFLDYVDTFNRLTESDGTRLDISFDDRSVRFLVRKSGSQLARHPYVLEFTVVEGRATNEQITSLAPYFAQFPYTDVTVLDAASDQMLFTTLEQVVLYNLRTKQADQVWDRSDFQTKGWVESGKLYPEHAAVYFVNYCDGMCPYETGYTSTTTVFMRNSGEQVLSLPFATTTGWEFQWNEDEVGGILHQPWSSEANSLSFTLASGEFAKTDVKPETPKYSEPGKYEFIDKDVTPIQYLPRPNQDDPYRLKIKSINDSNIESMYYIGLEKGIDAFGNAKRYTVSDVYYEEPFAWFFTNKGVVRFNENLKESNVFTATDGVHLDTSPVTETGTFYFADKIVLEDRLGTGIYSFHEPE